MVKALIFDVFGTVVDWRRGVADHVSRFNLQIDSIAFAEAWRAEYQPKMQEVRSGGRAYTPLDILHRENLDKVMTDFGLAGQLDEVEMTDLNRAWEHLPPWPDCVAGLTALKRAYTIAPCSNGSIPLMTALAAFGGLPWDQILGADVAQGYKPDPKVYLASAAALSLAPDQVMMVAAHNDDLAAARAVGLKTAFFPRDTEYGPDQKADLTATGDWDIIADDLIDLARRMGA